MILDEFRCWEFPQDSREQIISLDVGECEACRRFHTLTSHHVLPNFARQKLLKNNEAKLPWTKISLCGGCHYELHSYFTNRQISEMNKQQQINAIRSLLARMEELRKVAKSTAAMRSAVPYQY